VKKFNEDNQLKINNYGKESIEELKTSSRNY
jgi:hypothetical protein